MNRQAIESYPIKILEHHLDAYGHVNNVAYIGFLEQARWEFITSRGCGLEYVRSSNVGPVVLEIQTKFKKELRLRQEVLIKSQIESWRGKVGVMRQWFECKAGIVYCEARVTLGLFDLKRRKLVVPDDHWSKALLKAPTS